MGCKASVPQREPGGGIDEHADAAPPEIQDRCQSGPGKTKRHKMGTRKSGMRSEDSGLGLSFDEAFRSETRSASGMSTELLGNLEPAGMQQVSEESLREQSSDSKNCAQESHPPPPRASGAQEIREPSQDLGSMYSVGSAQRAARNGSARSSFAADALTSQGAQESMLVKNARTSMAILQHMSSHDAGLVPAALNPFFLKLAAVKSPMPVSMLQKLWQKGLEETLTLVHELSAPTSGSLRSTKLEDGSVWCLVTARTADALQKRVTDKEVTATHEALLDAYCATAGRKEGTLEVVALSSLPDDGYLMQNMCHHLIGAGRLNELRQLLEDPIWLEAKLHSYGMAAVVTDFRCYLAEHPEDAAVKLLLQALQLSQGVCGAHPEVHMLREQMLGRLIAVVQDKETNGQSAEEANAQVAKVDKLGHPVRVLAQGHMALVEWWGRQIMAAKVNTATPAPLGEESPVHLVAATASLKQAGGVQWMILRGQHSAVRKVVISPNGQDVITIADNGSAQVWDMNVGDSVLSTQLAGEQPLTDIAVAPGSLCVVASQDGSAFLWNLRGGGVKPLLGHTAKINSVAIDVAGTRCVSASDDGTVRAWQLSDGHCTAVMRPTSTDGATVYAVCCVALSSNGRIAATGGEDCVVRLWDVQSGTCKHSMEGHAGWVVSAAYIPHSAGLITASHDGTARVWNTARGKIMHVLEGHTGRVTRVVVDEGGGTAVTCSDDGSARVWDLDDGSVKVVLQGHAAWVADVALLGNSTRCITVGGDGFTCLWDCGTGTLLARLEGQVDALRSVVVTGGGRFAVTAGDGGATYVWDLAALRGVEEKGAEKGCEVKAHTSRVRSVLALPAPAGSSKQSERVVTSGDDGHVLMWDVGSGHVVQALQGNSDAAPYLGVSADGRTVVAGTTVREVCAWDAVSFKRAGPGLPAQQGSRVKMLAYNAAADRVASLLWDSTVGVWDVSSGDLVTQLIGRGERVGRNVHTGGVNGVLLFGGEEGDQGLRAVTWSKDCSARVWDVAACEVIMVLLGHTDGIRTAAMSPDQTMLATGSYGECVRLDLLSDGTALAVLDHASSAAHLLFSPDNCLLAVGLDDFSVVVWDLSKHCCLPTFVGHTEDIAGLAFTPDSRLLASCSKDGTARVWEAHTGRSLAFFAADAALSTCCFAAPGQNGIAAAVIAQDQARSSILADGKVLLVVGDVSGGVHFLPVPMALLA